LLRRCRPGGQIFGIKQQRAGLVRNATHADGLLQLEDSDVIERHTAVAVVVVGEVIAESIPGGLIM
jgi:hypothetical protein